MCYKCWIEHDSMNIVNCGLLAVKGKQYEKIVSRIKQLRRSLSEAISFGTRSYSRGDLSKLINLLERLLELDPEVRIRPEEILKHDFLVQR
jgi:serine/threonine protein kinase